MVARTRSQMRITLWLPNEVLTEIIQHAENDCPRSLWEKPLIPIKLFPVIGLTIKFRVNDWFSLDGQDWVAQIDYDLLFDSMKLMNNLQHLSLDNPRDSSAEPEVASILARLVFPNLSKCSIIMPHETTTITQFLAGNPSITCLHLPVNWRTFEPGRNLPNLREYMGPTSLLRSLATRGLRAAHLVPNGELTTSDMQAVKALTDPAIPFVLSVELATPRLPEDAIQNGLLLVSAQMPYIQRLQVRACGQKRFSTEIFNHITSHLPQLTHIDTMKPLSELGPLLVPLSKAAV
ncbi:hypothetical protein FB45DRAFT_1067601 [Roridomyces roridus]|uniref:Uncharacterized protein n=1 Tax=Roridomyces roridus TaxID=1738132 RepID=A0AAD7FB17_9AGAR|nr:hypothetical protein FB45DRAFT_1067601 [Roridomyces roridus]